MEKATGHLFHLPTMSFISLYVRVPSRPNRFINAYWVIFQQNDMMMMMMIAGIFLKEMFDVCNFQLMFNIHREVHFDY